MIAVVNCKNLIKDASGVAANILYGVSCGSSLVSYNNYKLQKNNLKGAYIPKKIDPICYTDDTCVSTSIGVVSTTEQCEKNCINVTKIFDYHYKPKIETDICDDIELTTTINNEIDFVNKKMRFTVSYLGSVVRALYFIGNEVPVESPEYLSFSSIGPDEDFVVTFYVYVNDKKYCRIKKTFRTPKELDEDGDDDTPCNISITQLKYEKPNLIVSFTGQKDPVIHYINNSIADITNLDLADGVYVYKVVDSDGCTATLNFTVSAPGVCPCDLVTIKITKSNNEYKFEISCDPSWSTQVASIEFFNNPTYDIINDNHQLTVIHRISPRYPILITITRKDGCVYRLTLNDHPYSSTTLQINPCTATLNFTVENEKVDENCIFIEDVQTGNRSMDCLGDPFLIEERRVRFSITTPITTDIVIEFEMIYTNCIGVEQMQYHNVKIIAGSLYVDFFYQWDNWVDCGQVRCEREFLQWGKMIRNSKGYKQC